MPSPARTMFYTKLRALRSSRATQQRADSSHRASLWHQCSFPSIPSHGTNPATHTWKPTEVSPGKMRRSGPVLMASSQARLQGASGPVTSTCTLHACPWWRPPAALCGSGQGRAPSTAPAPAPVAARQALLPRCTEGQVSTGTPGGAGGGAGRAARPRAAPPAGSPLSPGSTGSRRPRSAAPTPGIPSSSRKDGAGWEEISARSTWGSLPLRAGAAADGAGVSQGGAWRARSPRALRREGRRRSPLPSPPGWREGAGASGGVRGRRAEGRQPAGLRRRAASSGARRRPAAGWAQLAARVAPAGQAGVLGQGLGYFFFFWGGVGGVGEGEVGGRTGTVASASSSAAAGAAGSRRWLLLLRGGRAERRDVGLWAKQDLRDLLRSRPGGRGLLRPEVGASVPRRRHGMRFARGTSWWVPHPLPAPAVAPDSPHTVLCLPRPTSSRFSLPTVWTIPATCPSWKKLWINCWKATTSASGRISEVSRPTRARCRDTQPPAPRSPRGCRSSRSSRTAESAPELPLPRPLSPPGRGAAAGNGLVCPQVRLSAWGWTSTSPVSTWFPKSTWWVSEGGYMAGGGEGSCRLPPAGRSRPGVPRPSLRMESLLPRRAAAELRGAPSAARSAWKLYFPGDAFTRPPFPSLCRRPPPRVCVVRPSPGRLIPRLLPFAAGRCSQGLRWAAGTCRGLAAGGMQSGLAGFPGPVAEGRRHRYLPAPWAVQGKKTPATQLVGG